MDLATIEAEVAKLKAAGGAILKDDRWKSSRLWAIIVALVLAVVLHHFGIDREIVLLAPVLAVVFVLVRTLDDINRDRCNAKIEIARIAKGFDDGAPAKVSEQTAASTAPGAKP